MTTPAFDPEAAAEQAGLPAPSELPTPPSRQLAILTCMDARVMPHQIFGLEIGEVHVLRNAGARVTDDMLRSLALSSHLLGVTQVAVVHHSRCGGAASDEDLAAALRDAGVDADLPPLHGAADQVAALRADVEALRSSPLLDDDLVVTGHRYDVDTGRVVPLAELEAAQG